MNLSPPPLLFGRQITPGLAAPEDFVREETGWYLAGLTDGEGCFVIEPGRGCRFIIKLRADDEPLLEQLRDELGLGCLRRSTGRGGNRRDQTAWVIERKRELVWLTLLFDAFPLQSKKARDYALWREAVIAWYAGMPPAGLAEFAERLRETREFIVA